MWVIMLIIGRAEFTLAMVTPITYIIIVLAFIRLATTRVKLDFFYDVKLFNYP